MSIIFNCTLDKSTVLCLRRCSRTSAPTLLPLFPSSPTSTPSPLRSEAAVGAAAAESRTPMKTKATEG